jgi:hypothetical protein
MNSLGWGSRVLTDSLLLLRMKTVSIISYNRKCPKTIKILQRLF